MNYNIFTWIFNIPCNVIIFPCAVIIFPCAVIIFPCAVIVFPCAVIIFPCAVKIFLRYDDVDGDKAQVHQREVYFLWKQGGRGCVNTSDGISALNCITPPPSSQPFDFYLNSVYLWIGICICIWLYICAVSTEIMKYQLSSALHQPQPTIAFVFEVVFGFNLFIFSFASVFVFLGIKVIDLE